MLVVLGHGQGVGEEDSWKNHKAPSSLSTGGWQPGNGPQTLLGITGLLGPFSTGIGKAGIAISSQAFVRNLKGNTYYLVFHKGSDHEKITTLSAHDQGGGGAHKRSCPSSPGVVGSGDDPPFY